MNKKSLVLSVGIGLWTLMAALPSGGWTVKDQALQISISVYKGGVESIGLCPLSRSCMEATITVNQPSVVQYQVIRSDGIIGPVQTATFQGNVLSQSVQSWTTFDHEFDGWVAVHVISPLDIKSDHVPCKIKCLPHPNINQVRLATDGKLQIQVIGSNLRSPSFDTKNLLMDEKIISISNDKYVPNPQWTDGMIAVSNKNIVFADHTYEFKIKVPYYYEWEHPIISNVVSVKFLYPITDIQPAPAKAGGEVEIKILYLPDNPTGLTLRFASYNMEILSWVPGSSTIKAKIPHIVPGTYDVYLRKGAVVASTVAKIKVVGGG